MSHPLGPKTPPMDWGWPSGYFFLVLDDKVDNTGDGTPNKLFLFKNRLWSYPQTDYVSRFGLFFKFKIN